MDKGSQCAMTIRRLRDGGYVAEITPPVSGYATVHVFASREIEDVLRYIKDAIFPVGGPSERK